MMHHYLSMTNNVVDNDLSGTDVKLKKYFYALRPSITHRPASRIAYFDRDCENSRTREIAIATEECRP